MALPILPAAPATQSLSIVESLKVLFVVQAVFKVDVKVVSDGLQNLRVGFVDSANVGEHDF
jgi:hypothetical protein